MPRKLPPVETRFKPGQSGNPKGRPKKIPELHKLLADVLGEENNDKSAAYAILRTLRTKALKGDVRAAQGLPVGPLPEGVTPPDDPPAVGMPSIRPF